MSAQGAAGQEPVSLQDLLVEFPNISRVSIEEFGKVGWMYDHELWSDLVDRVKRNESNLEVSNMIVQVTQDEKARVRKLVDTGLRDRRFGGSGGDEKSWSSKQAPQEERAWRPSGFGKEHSAKSSGKGSGSSGSKGKGKSHNSKSPGKGGRQK